MTLSLEELFDEPDVVVELVIVVTAAISKWLFCNKNGLLKSSFLWTALVIIYHVLY